MTSETINPYVFEEYEKLLEYAGRADLVLTNPPSPAVLLENYGVLLDKFFDVSWQVLKPGGSVVVFVPRPVMIEQFVEHGSKTGFVAKTLGAVHPTKKKDSDEEDSLDEDSIVNSTVNPNLGFVENLKFWLLFVKPDEDGLDMPTVFNINDEESGFVENFCEYTVGLDDDDKEFGYHSSQIPAKVAEFFVKTLTNENGLVIDPFTYSGTVGVTSIRCYRKFLGVELDPDARAIARKKIDLPFSLI